MVRMPYNALALTTLALPAFFAIGFTVGDFFLKGARMPSIAEEVATDSSTLRFRRAGSLR